MATTPGLRVPAPATTPTPFGLLAAAQVLSGDAVAAQWRYGIEWEGSTTAATAATLDECAANAGDTIDEGGTKALTRGVDYPTGPGVTIYGGHWCSTGGRTRQEDRDRAGRALTNGEGYALERIVEAGGEDLGIDEDAVLPSLRSTAVMAPGTAPASLRASIAIAASIAAGMGTGVAIGGIVHAPYSVAEYLAGHGALVVRGARLETVLGVPVAAGIGYTGVMPTANDPDDFDPEVYGFLYVTGPMVVYRGPVELNPEASTIDRSVNDSIVIAERSYAYGWDGGVVAVPYPLAELAEPTEEG